MLFVVGGTKHFRKKILMQEVREALGNTQKVNKTKTLTKAL